MYQLFIDGISRLASDVMMDVVVFLNKNFGQYAQAQVEVFKDKTPMAIERSTRAFGILQPGSGKEIFLRMLDEVEKHYLKRDGVLRAPWQMMPYEWEAFVAIGSAVYRVYPCFVGPQLNESITYTDASGQETAGGLQYFMHAEMYHRYGYGNNGPEYGNGHDQNSRHDVHVAYALAEGKDVPEEVIEWYKAKASQPSDLRFFSTVLEYPEYRGAMSVKKLSVLCSLSKQEKLELTNENAGYFISQMAVLPDDASYTEIDDHLFRIGVLKVQPVVGYEPVDPSLAYNSFATLLRERLGESRKQGRLESANEKRLKGYLTMRELEHELQVAEAMPAAEGFSYPNQMAKAIEAKDVTYLLGMLDQADDSNITSRKAIAEVYGLKTLYRKAADRRTAIFEFCGYTPEQRAQYEADLAKAAEDKRKKREIEEIKMRAADVKYRMGDSEVITGAEYVDRCVAEGYNSITTRPRGKTVEYWIFNPDQGTLRQLRKNDGTLDYARLVHGLKDYQKAA